MRIFIYTLAILIILGCSQNLDKEHPLYTESRNVKTENHIRVLGTKIFAVVPEDFKYHPKSKSFTSGNQHIKFLKFPNVSWSEMSKKGDMLGRETISLYGFKGNYIELEDTKSKRIDIVVQFGGEDFVYMITAKTPNDEPESRNKILKILKSLYYDKSFELDELELANFTFDRKIIDYNLVVNSIDLYLLTDQNNNQIIFKSSFLSYNENLDDRFNKFMSAEKKRGIKFTNEEISSVSNKDHEGKTLESEMNFQSKIGIYCHAILIKNDTILEVTASGYEDTDELKSSFNRIVESVRFK